MKFKFILIKKVKVDHIDVDKWMFADVDFTKFSSSEVFIIIIWNTFIHNFNSVKLPVSSEGVKEVDWRRKGREVNKSTLMRVRSRREM